jgi:hypothetical protein
VRGGKQPSANIEEKTKKECCDDNKYHATTSTSATVTTTIVRNKRSTWNMKTFGHDDFSLSRHSSDEPGEERMATAGKRSSLRADGSAQGAGDDKLSEAIQSRAEDWIASSLRSSQ